MAMAAEAAIFSPEVEELLREIAKEPDSVLLRVPREKVPAALLETRSPIGPMTAGLSSAERELVRVHREEFAFQLRQACWVKLATSDEGHSFLNRRIGRNTDIPTPPIESIRHGIQLERSRALALGFTFPGDNSSDWILLEPDAWPRVTSVCAVAHRVIPAYQDWIYAALDSAFHGSLRSAVDLLEKGLAHRIDLVGLVQAYIAFCHDQAGNTNASLNAWQQAVEHNPERVDFLPSFLVMAMRVGNDHTIALADCACATALAASDRTVSGFVARLSGRTQLGRWRQEALLARAVRRWDSRLSAPGQVIVRSLT
jgi:hypothetical protein